MHHIETGNHTQSFTNFILISSMGAGVLHPYLRGTSKFLPETVPERLPEFTV
jgi:hypothetical protein